MGLGSVCCKLSAVLVAILAIGIGLLASGGAKQMGLFAYLDGFKGARGAFFKGMFPANHEGIAWGFTLEEMPNLAGETILVTGGNVGLGYWTAHHLASSGATVIIGCRDQEKCSKAATTIEAETGSKKVITASLDLGSFASIRACAASLAEAHSDGLDSLILNAGVMVPPFGQTEEGLEQQIGVNHFGHFLLTDLLLPQLEAAAAAKGVATVVAVSSAAHFDSYPEGILPTIERMNDESTYNRAKAYGQSKLANVLFAQELAARVKDKNILVNSIHPGGVDTNLGRHIQEMVARVSTSMAKGIKSFMASASWHPRDASLTQLYAAVGPKVRGAKVTGKYFHPIARETAPDLHAQNAELQAKLWAMSETFIAEH